MKNKIYVKHFSDEDNRRIDLIRRFVGVDSYETLRSILRSIEDGLHITDKELWRLRTYYSFDAETITVSSIKQYVDFYYSMIKDTITMHELLLQDAVEDFGNTCKEKWNGFIDKCKKVLE